MAVNFDHPLVGRAVVYTAWHPGAEAEQGTITSVNSEAGLVFVRYGLGSTSAATAVDDRLTFLDGKPVSLECDDCPPVGYPTDQTRCLPCPRRSEPAS